MIDNLLQRGYDLDVFHRRIEDGTVEDAHLDPPFSSSSTSGMPFGQRYGS